MSKDQTALIGLLLQACQVGQATIAHAPSLTVQSLLHICGALAALPRMGVRVHWCGALLPHDWP